MASRFTKRIIRATVGTCGTCGQPNDPRHTCRMKFSRVNADRIAKRQEKKK